MSPRPQGGRLRQALTGKALLALLRRVPGDDPSVHEPGVPPPDAERDLQANRGAERAAVAAFLLAALGFLAFAVLYVVFPDTQLLGVAIGGGLVFLAVALVVIGKKVVPQETTIEEREDFGDEELQEEVAAIVRRGGDGVTRRGMLMGAAGVAGATMGAAALFPLASLGPKVGDILHDSPWKPGRRVVDEEGRPLKVDDVEEGGLVNAFPEGADRDTIAAPIVLVRLPEDELEVPAKEKAGMPSGVVAFSKICPHAGCAISMYRYPLYDKTAPKPALVCPCHYSTFDVRRGGQLIFGPAGRALPRLPLAVNPAGELVANGDYTDGFGPSWSGVRERGNRS